MIWRPFGFPLYSLHVPFNITPRNPLQVHPYNRNFIYCKCREQTNTLILSAAVSSRRYYTYIQHQVYQQVAYIVTFYLAALLVN